MNRVIRLLAVTLLVLAFASAAMAENANQRVVGKKGIGFFNSEAPFGVRYWMSDGMAVDVGVGLSVNTKQTLTGTTGETTLTDFAFDVGLPFVIASEENMIVYFRPGASIFGDQIVVPGTGTPTPISTDRNFEYRGNLGLGGEFFLGQLGWPNLSFSGQVGVSLVATKPGAPNAKTTVNFATEHNDVSVVNTGSLGFHIYF